MSIGYASIRRSGKISVFQLYDAEIFHTSLFPTPPQHLLKV